MSYFFKVNDYRRVWPISDLHWPIRDLYWPISDLHWPERLLVGLVSVYPDRSRGNYKAFNILLLLL